MRAADGSAPQAWVLHPGDVALGLRGDRVETLLGSCVSIILTDPRRTVGAVCHYVHPKHAPSGLRDDTSHAAVAMAWMARALRSQGIEPLLCEAYVYGGGNMFPQLLNGPHVGERNVSWALDTLGAQGIRIVGQDIGGIGYRRLAWTVGPDAPEVTKVAV